VKTTVATAEGPPVTLRSTDRGKVLVEVDGHLVVLSIEDARAMARALTEVADHAERDRWKA
jgi:hypothetical protein